MNEPAAPVRNLERLAALREYRVLDTPAEAAFDEISHVAALICRVPAAAISFVDADRQWFKSAVGLTFREIPIEFSFCAHALHQPEVLVVPDALSDARFAANPLVVGKPHLRSYAGAVLISPERQPVGTVCVLDHRPRRYTPKQIEALLALAHLTMAQLELRRALAQAHRIGEQHARAMAIAGHDLMQPLQILSSLVERVALGGSAGAPDPGQIESARAAIDTLARELDALARISQSGRTPVVELVDVRLGPFMDEIADSWRPQAQHKGLTLRVVPTGAVARSDMRLLRVILGNLVGNAIKYTPPGGAVLIGCRPRGAGLVVEVRDNGIGFPESEHENIFKAFTRVAPHRADGLGLGLALVKQSADQLGCEIEARSRPGRGSVFSVALPRA